MTRERLREKTVEAIDRVLAHPILSGISDEDRHILQGWQAFVRQDDGTALDKVLTNMGEKNPLTRPTHRQDQ